MRKKSSMHIVYVSTELISRIRNVFIKYNTHFFFKALIFNSNTVYHVDSKELNVVESKKDLFSTKYNNLAYKIVSIVHFFPFENKIKPIVFNTL